MDIKTLSESILTAAMKQFVSDIYLFPNLEGYQLFFRIQQKHQVFMTLSEEKAQQVIGYFKFMGGMDVSEKRLIQAGSYSFKLNKQNYFIRCSTVANFKQKETLVLRIIYDNQVQGYQHHYFLPKQLETIQTHLGRRGLYIFSGPTGSGKTTTMYDLVKNIYGQQARVICIEDPVEITEPLFLQLQVNEKIALTYEALIKLCLRHRPDVLIIGEIRDTQTARAAIRAALTGHLVLSTLHSSSKEGVWERLFELGIGKEELDQCLGGVIYQRILPHYDPLPQKDNNRIKYGVLFDMLFPKQRRKGHAGERKKKVRKKVGKKIYKKYGHTASSQRLFFMKSGSNGKLKFKKQKQETLIHLLGELLEHGFSIQESFHFLHKIGIMDVKQFQHTQQLLSQGESLTQIFADFGFASDYLTQIYFAEIHGNLLQTFQQINMQMTSLNKQKALCSKILAYPSLLLLFVIGMLLGLKYFLLPNLRQLSSGETQNLLLTSIDLLPNLLVGILILSVCVIAVFSFYFKHKNKLMKAEFLSRLPVYGSFYKQYVTAFFAFEWGRFFAQEIDYKTIIEMMLQEKRASFMYELSQSIQKKLEKGEDFGEILSSYPFFQKELPIIINQGVIKGKLGEELMIYGYRLWQLMFAKMEKRLALIQPLMLCLVAFMILGLYLSLLLPIYQEVNQFL